MTFREHCERHGIVAGARLVDADGFVFTVVRLDPRGFDLVWCRPMFGRSLMIVGAWDLAGYSLVRS